MIAGPQRFERSGLEEIFDQRSAGRSQQYERGEVTQVRRFGDDAQARPAIGRGGRVAQDRRRRRFEPDGELPYEPGAEELQRGEDEQHRRDAPGRDVGGQQRAEQSSDSAGARNLSETPFRGARVEAFRGNEPEA